MSKLMRYVPVIATFTGLVMYVSYIDQIRLNLEGASGSVIQPAIAVINCSFWVAYGFFRDKIDWPIVIANAPGIVFGSAAVATAM
jgi:uncharacterized protein with PQ loop repeat